MKFYCITIIVLFMKDLRFVLNIVIKTNWQV